MLLRHTPSKKGVQQSKAKEECVDDKKTRRYEGKQNKIQSLLPTSPDPGIESHRTFLRRKSEDRCTPFFVFLLYLEAMFGLPETAEHLLHGALRVVQEIDRWEQSSVGVVRQHRLVLLLVHLDLLVNIASFLRGLLRVLVPVHLRDQVYAI